MAMARCMSAAWPGAALPCPCLAVARTLPNPQAQLLYGACECKQLLLVLEDWVDLRRYLGDTWDKKWLQDVSRRMRGSRCCLANCCVATRSRQRSRRGCCRHCVHADCEPALHARHARSPRCCPSHAWVMSLCCLPSIQGARTHTHTLISGDPAPVSHTASKGHPANSRAAACMKGKGPLGHKKG